MAAIRAEFVYPVNGLVVERSLLGGSVTAEQGRLEVQVCIPLNQSDGAPRQPPAPFEGFDGSLDLALRPGTTELMAGFEARQGELADVDRVLVRVTWHEEPDSELTASDALRKGCEVSNKVMASLVALLRSEGYQAWLGLSGDAPQPESQRVLNLDEGVRLPNPAVVSKRIRVVDPRSALGIESLRAFADRAVAGEEVPLAEALLADALYFQWEHFPQAAAVSVLLAAIACEVKVKEVLRATAGNKLALVEVLLGHPRDYSMAARSLFSDAMEGCSKLATRSRIAESSYRLLKRKRAGLQRPAHSTGSIRSRSSVVSGPGSRLQGTC